MDMQIENVNQFFNEYPVKNIACNHNILKDYEKLFSIFDGSFGHLSYLEFQSNDNKEIFLGSYPLNGSDIWKCRKCGKLKFFYNEIGGHLPRTISLDVDFSKIYLANPLAKSLTINKSKIEEFINQFHFPELENFQKIEPLIGQKIINKKNKYVFGYYEMSDKIIINLIADKDLLIKIYEFENQEKKKVVKHNILLAGSEVSIIKDFR